MNAMAPTDFTTRLDKTAEDTETLLSKLLSDTVLSDETARPKRLVEAMRYSSLGGGKRLRPFLVVESAAVFGTPREAALLVGAALECIHCYSLIHDDLPAMDNSDLRRGRPTLHKAYDDATAILAGDALLTIAFDIITRDEIHSHATVRLLLTRALARAAARSTSPLAPKIDSALSARAKRSRTRCLAPSMPSWVTKVVLPSTASCPVCFPSAAASPSTSSRSSAIWKASPSARP